MACIYFINFIFTVVFSIPCGGIVWLQFHLIIFFIKMVCVMLILFEGFVLLCQNRAEVTKTGHQGHINVFMVPFQKSFASSSVKLQLLKFAVLKT
ncbi:hypothetical protein L9F63_016202, partial [Diploptera punctata]